MSSVSPRSILGLELQSLNKSFETKLNSSNTLLDDYRDYNETELYDYLDHLQTDKPALIDSPVTPGVDIRSMKQPPSLDPDDVVLGTGATYAAEKMKVPSWAFPTVSTIKAEMKFQERVVGGDEAIPGEIPWQVLL